MKIAICGLSGFVGTALKEFLSARGDEIIGLSHRSSSHFGLEMIDGADVVINLAGAPIIGRWSASYKQTLTHSRIETTRQIVEKIKSASNPPKLLINASAIGIYASNRPQDENSYKYENDFLSQLVQAWEGCALEAQSDATRVCILRFGVVYGATGGAMAKMLPPFRWNLGGILGDGGQMISWIHLHDLTRIFEFVIDRPHLQGAINATAPHPLTNAAQTAIMAKALRRVAILPLPAWLIKMIFGEGSTIMLDSKEVYPTILEKNGFVFDYPTFERAMEEIAAQLS